MFIWYVLIIYVRSLNIKYASFYNCSPVWDTQHSSLHASVLSPMQEAASAGFIVPFHEALHKCGGQLARCWIVEAASFSDALEMIFTLTGGEYNLRYFLRYVFFWHYRISGHPITGNFSCKAWQQKEEPSWKALKLLKIRCYWTIAKCLASRIYYGGTSFLQQVSFLSFLGEGFLHRPSNESNLWG